MSSKTGVLIGKFQVPYLAEHHKKIISTVHSECENALIFLLVPQIKYSKRNPMSFDHRKEIIQSFIDSLPSKKGFSTQFAVIDEHKYAASFFKHLDNLIKTWHQRKTVPVIYYGGDAEEVFVEYNGAYEKKNVGWYEVKESASAIRAKFTRQNAKVDPDYGMGVLDAVWNAPNNTLTFVIPIIVNSNGYVLMVKHTGEFKWGLPRFHLANPGVRLEEFAVNKFRDIFPTGSIKEGEYKFSYCPKEDWRFRYIDHKPLYLCTQHSINEIPSCSYGLISEYSFINPVTVVFDDIEEEFHEAIKKIKVFYGCHV
jgi:nicotinamide mononucleotide adenylyltransferase